MATVASTHSIADRRADLRARLVEIAEAEIATSGLESLRARRLAELAGCSVGAIYNLVADLDELVLLVAQRTLTQLNARLDAAAPAGASDVAHFIAWAHAYCAFAAAHGNLWRALFAFRLAPGGDLPDWFEADRMRLFERLEQGLAARLPALEASTRKLRARTLFSAVHGIVSLGLEEKLAAVPVATVEAELAAFVTAYLNGLAV